MPRRPPLIHFAAAALLALPAAHAQPVVAEKDRFGDIMRLALPAAAATLSYAQDDNEGLKQLAMSMALSQGSTALLKARVSTARPDGGRHGFPSGHTSLAFTAAAYVHKRYSLAWALPMYGLSVATGIQRVRTNNHFKRDVVGGALIGIVSSWVMTSPLLPAGATAAIGYVDGTFMVHYASEW